VQGDKSDIHHQLAARLCLEGVTYISANYRFSKDPEYLAPLLDAARVIQFLRHHAADYGLDPSKIAAGGGSAGAASACWLALGQDRAQPQSPDLIARQSTRLQCVAAFQAQTTLDPRAIRQIVPGKTWMIPAFQKLYRLTPDQYDLPEHSKQLDALSFLDWVSADAPPFFFWNTTPDYPLTPDLNPEPGIHHPVFGRALKARLDPFGIECVLQTVEQFPSLKGPALENRFLEGAGDFLLKHLKPEKISP
jgi:acetyl esterase/lipase